MSDEEILIGVVVEDSIDAGTGRRLWWSPTGYCIALKKACCQAPDIAGTWHFSRASVMRQTHAANRRDFDTVRN
jgi:hypothetical protein